jgi:spermidine/putrescine transport system substrate-binding protein
VPHHDRERKLPPTLGIHRYPKLGQTLARRERSLDRFSGHTPRHDDDVHRNHHTLRSSVRGRRKLASAYDRLDCLAAVAVVHCPQRSQSEGGIVAPRRHPKEKPSGGLHRRDFLLRSAAAAGSIPAMSAILAACRSPQDSGDPLGDSGELVISTPEDPKPLKTFPENAPVPADAPIEGGPLKIYNWDQYIYKKVVDDFSEAFGVDVEISTFNNMDEALAKIRSSQVDFDVFFPTVDVLGKMTQFQLLQPLNFELLPNRKNLWASYTAPGKPWYDVGGIYTVPYTVYSTGVGYRNDLVEEKDWPANIKNGYDLLWNEKYRNKLGIYDDYRTAMGMVLLRNGTENINSSDPAELSAVKDSLTEMSAATNVALTINGAYEDLPKGIFSAHQAWSGDILASPWYGKGNWASTWPLMSYWWPKGGEIGNDLMAVLRGAKNPVLGHAFINYMLDFDPAMKNFSWNGYQPPQNDALPETFQDPNFKWSWVVPPSLNNCIVTFEDIEGATFQTELPPTVDAMWHDNWDQFTAGT